MALREKAKQLKDGANIVYHGAKGLEKATSVQANDTGLNKTKKIASAIKHLASAVEKCLRFER